LPTPIGNLGDITLRSIHALKEADFIACEDTRHSRPLLKHLGIEKPLIALHDHNEARKADELIEQIQNGSKIAIISDAGMPAISDPGYRLLQAAIKADIRYTVLPGSSAVLTALVGSGFPTHAFFFNGFLPVKKGKRSKVMLEASMNDYTSIFFESPHRIISTLELLNETAPTARVCIARELTKKFETYHRGTAAELIESFGSSKVRGEIVLLITANGAG